MPRLASCRATMRRRWRRVSGAGPRTNRAPRLPSHTVNYSLTPFIVRRGPLPEPPKHRILLVGDAATRPDGLERFLVRGGFQVTEAVYPPPGPDRPEPQPPDLLILSIAAKEAGLAEGVRDLATAARFGGAPVIVLVADGGADAVADALQAGARDALASPVHFGELRARIDADLRLRRELSEAQDALRTRDLLFDIFQEVSATLRADEIFQTLVRRVGHAFGLTHCSFVLTAPGEDKGRVVAVYENPAIRDLRVELERYPEIQEAIRTERPVLIPDVHEHPLFEAIRRRWTQQRIAVNVQSAVALPVFVQGRAAGVFFLRTVQGGPVLAELGAMMQREIRAPDFVARYGGDEFALVLPETDTQGGRHFVERLRQVLARHTFPDLPRGQVLSLTAGVVAFPHAEVLRPEDLFTQVEAALERGKKSEPDRIGVSGGASAS